MGNDREGLRLCKREVGSESRGYMEGRSGGGERNRGVGGTVMGQRVQRKCWGCGQEFG